MHRQAMLVSLSLSPASTAAKNDKHWAFLEEIDAPQWADLKAEEFLAKAGTIGDDPWFYRSHSHHEVPLTEITGGHADTEDPNSASIRTPQLERKKNRASSKAKLAFDGTTAAKSKDAAREDHHDESPRADFSSDCHETFGEPRKDRISSPVLCKSPERFSFARRFMSSATFDDHLGGNDRTGVLESFNLRLNLQENQYGQMSTQPDVSMSDSSARQSAGVCEVEDKPALSSMSSIPWQDSIFSRLNDTSRLRKSLGSALRVKIDDSADNSGTKRQGTDTLPKSRLVRQSVQLEASALPGTSGSETESTSLKNDDGVSSGNCHSDRVRPGDGLSAPAPTNRLGINSSVEAFDDIRKMRKSWGSALRVKVSDEPAVEDASSKLEVSEVSPVSDAREDRKSDTGSAASSLKLDKLAADFPSVVEMKAIRTGSEEKKFPGIKVPAVVRAYERREHNPIDRRKALGSVKELEVGSPKVPAAVAKKNFRRSVSFDHTPGRGTDKTFISSSRSNLIQQKQGSRASPTPSARSNGPADKIGTVTRLSKGGKENTSVHSSTQSKLNPEPSVGSPRISRQSVTRMSMPSLTFAAHARAAMRENGGSNLKPGNNGVVESNRSDSSKASTPAATFSLKKSVTPLENVSRRKTPATPAPISNPPPKMATRQSALRSSMPVFSTAAIKKASKPAPETGAAHRHEEKKLNKIGNADAELAALLAEHNRKFRPKPKYEPRIHSVKDIREWEARTGQLFYNLLPADRERANQEISAAKQTRPKHVPC